MAKTPKKPPETPAEKAGDTVVVPETRTVSFDREGHRAQVATLREGTTLVLVKDEAQDWGYSMTHKTITLSAWDTYLLLLKA